MKLTRLGVHRNVPIDEYHADSSAISNTGLNDFRRSPEHYFALHLDPKRPPPHEDKAARLVGQLAHTTILEPDQFALRYAVGPNINRNTVKWKEFEEQTKADGKVAIKEHQAAAAWAQAKAIRSYPDVAALLSGGESEVSAWWTDPATGVRCRCRPDHVSPAGSVRDAVILLDVKTYSSAARREFTRQVRRMGYHRQDVFYSDGYEIASGMQVLGFVFIVTETEWPYAAAAYMLGDRTRDGARRQVASLLARYADCLREQRWPSYSDSVDLIELDDWELGEE